MVRNRAIRSLLKRSPFPRQNFGLSAQGVVGETSGVNVVTSKSKLVPVQISTYYLLLCGVYGLGISPLLRRLILTSSVQTRRVLLLKGEARRQEGLHVSWVLRVPEDNGKDSVS